MTTLCLATAHRSVVLFIVPYTRRGSADNDRTDSTQPTTVGFRENIRATVSLLCTRGPMIETCGFAIFNVRTVCISDDVARRYVDVDVSPRRSIARVNKIDDSR
jgi:hypothetical protein